MRNDFSIFFPHIQWITKVAAGSRPSFLMAFTASYKIQASNTIVSVKILATITARDNMFWESLEAERGREIGARIICSEGKVRSMKARP